MPDLAALEARLSRLEEAVAALARQAATPPEAQQPWYERMANRVRTPEELEALRQMAEYGREFRRADSPSALESEAA